MSPRIILLPFAMLLEAALLALVMAMTFVSPLKALAIVDWVVTTLPDRSWYKGGNAQP